MAKIAINMITTEQGTGRKLQKTLTDINAEATSAQIKTFATALNGLTTNVYGETNRIEKLNVDTEEAPVIPPEKEDTTLTITDTNHGEVTALNPLRVNLTYKDVNFTVTTNNTTGTVSFINHPIVKSGGTNYIGAAFFDNGTSTPGRIAATAFCQETPTAGQELGTIDVIIAESDTHKAASKSIRVTGALS